MGTRSMTYVCGEDRILCAIYRQFDGYPDGHGQDLFNLLKERKIANGIPAGTDLKTWSMSNGMGCLAARLVGDLKHGQIGNIYLEEPPKFELPEGWFSDSKILAQFSEDARRYGGEYAYVLVPPKELGHVCDVAVLDTYAVLPLYRGPADKLDELFSENVSD